MSAVLRGNAAILCAQIVSRYYPFKMSPACFNVTLEEDESPVNLTCSDDTCDHYVSTLGHTGDYIVGCYLLFIIFTAALLNGFVIWSFASRQKAIISVDYYILTLAISDLSCSVCAYPLTMASTVSHRWLFGDIGCIINGFFAFFFGIVDIFILSLLSFTRFLCVCYPDTFSRLTKSKVIMSLALGVSMAGFWAFCPLFGWGDYGTEPFGTSCTLKWAAADSSYLTSMFVGCLVLPLLVMGVSYGSILHYTTSASRRLRQYRTDKTQRRAHHEMRLIKITLLMTTCFLVAWLPYSVLSLASTYGKNLDISGPTSLLPTLLAKASHVTNPVVYFTMNPRYKRHVPCCSVSLFKNWISFSSEACQDELDMKLKMLYRKNGLKELTDVTQPASTAGTTNTCLGSCTTMVFPPA